MLDWGDERYVRMYTRDTPDFLVLSLEAQGLLELIMRKLDRAGVLHLGKQGKRGVAIAINHPHRWTTIEPALDELLLDGCLVIAGAALVMPNFLEAQTAVQSDRMRQQVHRERRRDLARAQEAGLPVTIRDPESHGVTESHVQSRDVTFGHSDPCLTVPSGMADASAPPCDPDSVASSSQLPDPEPAPTMALPMGSPPSDAPPVDNPATGRVSRARAKREPAALPAEAVELAEYMLAAIRSHKPDVVANVKGWAKDIDLALRLDHRSSDDIRSVIDFAHRSRDTFWRANLLSGAKLRAHFDQVQIQARRAAPPQSLTATNLRDIAAEARRRGM